MLVGLRDYQDEKADVILKCGAAWVGRAALPWLQWRTRSFKLSVSLNDVVTLRSLDNIDGPGSSMCLFAARHWLPCACARPDVQLRAPGRYMADEARSLKAYGELPENSARHALC